MIVMSLHLRISAMLAISLVALPLTAVDSSAQEADLRIAMIDSLMREAEVDGLNGVLRIEYRDNVWLHKAYGYADREAGRRMTTGTGFDIGSLVKPITAVAILKLEEQGRLSTEDTLGRYFPAAPPDKAGITIMQILTHTSGMRDVFGGDYDVVTRDWLLAHAMSAPLLGPPGEAERYSNSGYSILAMIIEDVSGLPYESYVRSAVLEPAGADRIGYILATWSNEELAVGYLSDGTRWGTPLDHAWAEDGPSWNLRGNGGMLSTAEQMAAWYSGLFDGLILGSTALQKFYSFDAGRSTAVGGRAIGHAGGNGIFNTLQVSYIDKDFHLTFFTSSAGQQAEVLWQKIREEVRSLARGEPAPQR